MRGGHKLLALGALGLGMHCGCGQEPPQQRDESSAHLLDAGQILVAGKPTAYTIRHLPVSSYPQLPAEAAAWLTERGCTIPQTYEAHRPENVVRASLERAGSADWAVLCSVKGTVSLLVFLESRGREGARGAAAALQGEPVTLATELETHRLQVHDASGALGFNWGIDPATPRQVHDAQMTLKHRPARLDHDALADAELDHRTVYHYFSEGVWTLLEMPDE